MLHRQGILVELGFRHHFLLRGISATAAVHKASVYQDEATELLLQSSMHMDMAIKTFMEHTANPDPATCVPVFAMAMLVAMHRMGIAQVHVPSDLIKELCVYSRLLRGSKTTVLDHWDRLLASEMAPVIRGITSIMNQKGATGSYPEILRLKDLINEQQSLSPSLRTQYLTVIDTLHEAFVHILEDESRPDQAAIGIITSWIAQQPTEFLDGMVNKEPVALVITAHFATLIRSKERLWWLRHWSKWLLEAVDSSLDPSFASWLEWPRKGIFMEAVAI